MLTMSDKLNQWVTKKLKDKGWNRNELARRSGLNSGTISNVLNGKREAGAKFYLAMGRAFDVSPEAIERLDREGVDPDNIEDLDADFTLRELIEISRQLTNKQRFEALKYLIYLRRTGGDDDETDDE